MRLSCLLLVFTVCATVTAVAQSLGPAIAPTNEQALWDLERAYWRYVQDNDLPAYKQLWHENFVGWPSVSSTPVHKDRITEWITSQTAKGLIFSFVDFNPAAIQVTDNTASVYYRIAFKWLDKQEKGALVRLRIAHTWVKSGGSWRIIAGMSMPEPDNSAK